MKIIFDCMSQMSPAGQMLISLLVVIIDLLHKIPMNADARFGLFWMDEFISQYYINVVVFQKDENITKVMSTALGEESE